MYLFFWFNDILNARADFRDKIFFGRIKDTTIYFRNVLTFTDLPEMISTNCVGKLTHCKAVSSPLNDSLSISHLTSEKNCISLIDSLVFGHLNIVLCLEGRPILLVVFRMHEFWKRREEICKTRKKMPLGINVGKTCKRQYFCSSTHYFSCGFFLLKR